MNSIGFSKVLQYFILPSGAVTGFTFLSAEDGLVDLISVFTGDPYDSNIDFESKLINKVNNKKKPSSDVSTPKPVKDTKPVTPPSPAKPEAPKPKVNKSPENTTQQNTTTPPVKSEQCKVASVVVKGIQMFDYTGHQKGLLGAWWAWKFRTGYEATVKVEDDCTKVVTMNIVEHRSAQSFAYVPQNLKLRYLFNYTNYYSLQKLEAHLKTHIKAEKIGPKSS